MRVCSCVRDVIVHQDLGVEGPGLPSTLQPPGCWLMAVLMHAMARHGHKAGVGDGRGRLPDIKCQVPLLHAPA